MNKTPEKAEESVHEKRKSFTPVGRKVTYQQLVTFGDKSLYRSVSCGQIWTPTNNFGSGIETTQVAVSTFNLPAKRRISFVSDTNDSSRRKKLKAARTAHTPSSPPPAQLSRMHGVLLILFVGIVFYLYLSWKPNPCIKWSTASLHSELSPNIFGQESALNSLKRSLSVVSLSERPTLIILSGPVGVGKTFIARTIFNHFPCRRNAVYTVPSEFPYVETTDLFSEFEWNLLIVDDLNRENSVSLLSAVNGLMYYAVRHNSKLLVIVVYTSEMDETVEDIEKFVKSMPDFSHFTHIPLNLLSRESIEKCFRALIQKESLVLTDEDIKAAMKDHSERTGRSAGCKSVHTSLLPFYDDKM